MEKRRRGGRNKRSEEIARLDERAKPEQKAEAGGSPRAQQSESVYGESKTGVEYGRAK